MSRNARPRTAKLDQLASVERGRSRHRPRNAPHLYGGPYPFVQTGEVKAAEFWIHGIEQTYSDAGLEQSRLWPAGTVCVTIAANIAESGILAVDACFPDSVVGVTPLEGIADENFLKYALDYMKLRLQAISGGTTQDNLSLEKLLSFDFPAPPIDSQLQIAHALRAFDDLIENNRRRIEILEEMARLLYREWFVHFRFPGHEDVELVDSDLGPIPEGWEWKTSWRKTPSRGDRGNWTEGMQSGSNSKRFAESGAIRACPHGEMCRGTAASKGTLTRIPAIDGWEIHPTFSSRMDGDFHMCRWADGLAHLNQRVARLRAPKDPSEVSQLRSPSISSLASSDNSNDFNRKQLANCR